MPTDWQLLCRGRGFQIDGDRIDVKLADGRRHWVAVEDGEDIYSLSAVVTRAAVVSDMPELPVQLWRLNRNTSLVGFRIDARGRLVGESWVPKIGATADEFGFYLRMLAAESDRLEYMLTGRDTE